MTTKKQISYNNKIDRLPQKELDQIINLRIHDHLSYAKIAKKLNISPYFVFKVIKKHIGLKTHTYSNVQPKP